MGTWEGLLSTMNRPNEVKHLTALRWARRGATVNLELRVCISTFGVVFPFPQTVSERCFWESPADPSLIHKGGCTWWDRRTQNPESLCVPDPPGLGEGLSGKTPASFADITVGGLLLTKSW